MRIIVVDAEPVVIVEDPDDCTRFSVAVPGLSVDRAAELLTAAVAGSAAEPPEHVFVRVEAVRNAVKGDVGPDWTARFDGMLSYAGSRGWLSDDGASILAHVER